MEAGAAQHGAAAVAQDVVQHQRGVQSQAGPAGSKNKSSSPPVTAYIQLYSVYSSELLRPA